MGWISTGTKLKSMNERLSTNISCLKRRPIPSNRRPPYYRSAWNSVNGSSRGALRVFSKQLCGCCQRPPPTWTLRRRCVIQVHWEFPNVKHAHISNYTIILCQTSIKSKHPSNSILHSFHPSNIMPSTLNPQQRNLPT